MPTSRQLDFTIAASRARRIVRLSECDISYRFREWVSILKSCSHQGDASMDNIWPYFEWQPPQLAELAAILDNRLRRLIEPLVHEEYLPDVDEQCRNRSWR